MAGEIDTLGKAAYRRMALRVSCRLCQRGTYFWANDLAGMYGNHRSPESLTGWLVTVTRHNARKIRATERRVELVEPHRLTEEPDPLAHIDTDLLDRERYRCLLENLRKLPPTCQVLLRILAFTGHTSSRTVLDVLDMPPGSIGPTRGRCLAKLRTLLENDPRWSS